MSVAVVIPYGGNDPARQRNLRTVLSYYRENAPAWPVMIRGPWHGFPFSRSRAIHHGMAEADAALASVVVVNDADSLVPFVQLADAVTRARDEDALVWAYTVYCRLGQADTEGLARWQDVTECEPVQVIHDAPSLGVSVIRRETYYRAGGYDPRFVGWGYEDSAFALRCQAAGVPLQRVDGPLYHLYHDPAPGADWSDETSEDEARNRALFKREYANG